VVVGNLHDRGVDDVQAYRNLAMGDCRLCPARGESTMSWIYTLVPHASMTPQNLPLVVALCCSLLTRWRDSREEKKIGNLRAGQRRQSLRLKELFKSLMSRFALQKQDQHRKDSFTVLEGVGNSVIGSSGKSSPTRLNDWVGLPATLLLSLTIPGYRRKIK
jgi:hypothetical protein